jgi:hypothetical protein
VATGEENVFRFDVTVYDAIAMSMVERTGYFPRETQCFVQRKLPLAPESIAQRLAARVRHYIVEESISLSRIMERHDVRMLQTGGGSDFAKEAFGSYSGRDFLAQHFDCNRPVMLAVLRAKNRCHSPAADFAFEVVTIAENLRHLPAVLEEEREALRRSAVD